MKTKYSFKKGLWKSLVALAIIGIPIVTEMLPTEYLNMTLGGGLFLFGTHDITLPIITADDALFRS